MKFLAMLKDSLLEAIDAWVFYVMLGLSALLILLASTATFTPRPGGKFVGVIASVPLNVDLTDLDPADFSRPPPEDGDAKGPRRGPRGGGLGALAGRMRGNYQLGEVKPVAGEEDLPGSTFTAVVTAAGTAEGIPGLGALFGRPKPEKVAADLRERFGVFEEMRLVEVLDIKPLKDADYLVTLTFTDAGRRLWPHNFGLFFGYLPVFKADVPLGAQLYAIENIIVNTFGSWITLLVSVILTSFFIPNMLRKGTVDMLVVKPMSRTTLLLYKYVGGLLFIFINTAVAVVGIWVVLGLRSGVWPPSFLLSVPAITFYFAILYSVSTLFAVLTRSPIVCIVMTFLAWVIMFVAGVTKDIVNQYEEGRKSDIRRNVATASADLIASASPWTALAPAAALAAGGDRLVYEDWWFPKVARAVHFVLPRTGDMNTLMDARLQKELLNMPRSLTDRSAALKSVSWGESLAVSGLFVALMLGLSCWWFATRDY